MNEEFPFTKEYLKDLPRDDLVKLAHYSNMRVRRSHTNEQIIERLWDKYYPDVLVCDSNRLVIPCERTINDDGDEIIEYDGQEYNLTKMSVRIYRILMAKMEEGK
jgi:hypothetical protein